MNAEKADVRENAPGRAECEWAVEPTIERSHVEPGLRLTSNERRLLLSIVDLILVNSALLIALITLNDFTPTPQALWSGAKYFITLTAVWTLFGLSFDIYNPARAASTRYSLLHSGWASLLTTIGYLTIPWLTPPVNRRVYAAAFVLLTTGLIALWRTVYARSFHQPSFLRRVLVVGSGPVAQRITADLQAGAEAEDANPFRGTGCCVVGTARRILRSAHRPLDPALALMRGIRLLDVDEVLVADRAGLSPAYQEALLDCRELGIRVTPLSNLYERLAGRLPVEYAERDLSLIADTSDNPINRLYAVSKAGVDAVLSLVGLLAMAVLMPIVAVANALTSPGPLFYYQQRVGQGGRPFTLIKFRTMRPQAESEEGAVWACDDDPRITPHGRWMRRLRLDELPQVINVLRGEMSFVGPRPERPEFVGEIARALPIYRARHAVKPGITGWAQIRYHYGSSVEDARIKLEYDLFYLKHAGLYLDTLILLKTLPAMLQLQGK
jgi:exopolysaccharide biosynthesis polyprenyl glycosylphosphotransferase